VLETRPLSDEDGDGEPGRAADAVAEPHGRDACVLDGDLLRRLDCGAHRLGLRRLSSVCAQRVDRGLAGGVRRCPDPKRRLQGPSIVGQLVEPLRQRVRDGVARGVQRREVDAYVAALQAVRARAEHLGRRCHRLRVLGREWLGRRRQEGEKPVQLVRERRERGHGGRRTGWSVLAAEKPPAERVDCLAGQTASLGELVRAR